MTWHKTALKIRMSRSFLKLHFFS